MIHPESVKQWQAETEYFQGRIGALKAENAKLVGWLRRHARYNPDLTDKTEWNEIQTFLKER